MHLVILSLGLGREYPLRSGLTPELGRNYIIGQVHVVSK